MKLSMLVEVLLILIIIAFAASKPLEPGKIEKQNWNFNIRIH